MAHKKVLLKKAGSIGIFINDKKSSKKKCTATLVSLVPVLTVLVDCLEKQGREIEGLFRVNGAVSQLNNLRDDLLSRPPGDLFTEDIWDPHVVAGLIKLLLRELEEPLLMFNLYDHLLGSLDVKDDKAQLQVIKAIIDSLPKENRFILSKLLHLFFMLSLHESVTKMSAHNLAVVMGPTIMRPSGESFDTMMSDSSKVVSVVTILIENAEFFCKSSGESITISSPVNLNEQEMGQLLPNNAINIPSRVEKRDLRKKYDELKKNHQELLQNYDELRTQYSVLEAYSAKMDLKVSELEDLLESMDHAPSFIVPRNESDSSLPPIEDESVDELTKLRMENEWLREVLIRATREDVVNLRESQDPIGSFRIKSPRDSSTITSPLTTSNGPVKRVSSSSLILDSLNQSSNILDSNSNGPEEPSTSTSFSKAASRKSAKLTNAFIKKQSSTKIIQKIKSHKNLDPRKALEATGNLPSTLSNTNDSKRPLNAINESSTQKSELTTSNSDVKLPPLPIEKPPSARSRRSLIKNDESRSLALTSSCRNIVPPIGVLSPGKVGLSRQNTIGPTTWKKSSEINSSAGADSSGNTTPLSLSERTDRSEGNKENLLKESSRDNREIRERENRENRENREKRRSYLSRDSSRVHEKDISGLLDVIQKMIELEQNTAPQKSENEIRKQLEDVRNFVSSMVGSLTHLSHSQK